MADAPQDEGRPSSAGTALETPTKKSEIHLTSQSDNFTAPDDPHCSRCHRPISTPRSLAFGMGPRCRQLQHADFVSEVFEAVLATC